MMLTIAMTVIMAMIGMMMMMKRKKKRKENNTKINEKNKNI
jgi:predicted membrane protein